ncbi:hypothetical protein PINS_up010313 [Pythium insidiosum]|nr:hypothetical protein PINS_up010313 [Pythium insidiosum]
MQQLMSREDSSSSSSFSSSSSSSSASFAGEPSSPRRRRRSPSHQDPSAKAPRDNGPSRLNPETPVDNQFCRVEVVRQADQTCKRPRRCEQCLQLAGCVLEADGECVSAASANDSVRDFRTAPIYHNRTSGVIASFRMDANLTATQAWRFPATAVSYCPRDDAVCAQCRATLFALHAPDARFCVGRQGCVCIALCDSEAYAATLRQNDECPSKEPSSSNYQGAYMLILGSAIALVLCVSFYKWFSWKSKQLERDSDSDSDDVRSDGDGDVTAFGRHNSIDAAQAQRKPPHRATSAPRGVPPLSLARADSTQSSRLHP